MRMPPPLFFLLVVFTRLSSLLPFLLSACTCLEVVDVPEDCVGFVMGRGGNTLRSMEEEWGSLMFFAQVSQARFIWKGLT